MTVGDIIIIAELTACILMIILVCTNNKYSRKAARVYEEHEYKQLNKEEAL